MLIGIVDWIVLGTVVGFIFTKLVPVRGDNYKPAVLMAVAAAVAGGSLFCLFTHAAVSSFNPGSFFNAAVAAVVVLVVWNRYRRKLAA
jgi:uncharacterized membrane protein YeaQ/YmgE (transglycosylase-associated protein family)